MLKYFTVADRWVDLVVRWVGFALIVTGGFTWLASQTTRLGALNLAELLAVGIGATLFTLLVLSALIAAIAYLRSNGSEQQGDAAANDRGYVSYPDLRTSEQRLTSSFNERMAAFEPHIPRLIDHVKRAEEKEWREQLDKLKEKIEPRPLQTGPLRDPVMSNHQLDAQLSGAMNDLSRLGFPPEMVRDTVNEAAGRIRGDALYAQIPAAEAERWGSPEERQRWYVRDASYAALRRLVGEAHRHVQERRIHFR